jgi:iron(III) transport system ATP-binding protein
MTSVAVLGLHKSFGGPPVLSGLDLDVPHGSLTAVLGPSGSGKTTLLRILAGFERADRGRVLFGGKVVADAGRVHMAPERRRIGYVPQDGALFPHLSVARNVGFGLGRHTDKPGRVDELLELVGLAGQGPRYPHQLSGGQQQRVALARALAARPGLVLLDEPFSSLDAALRAGLRADVQRVLREESATAILVTHDQDEALSLADQVAVLRDGKVAQLDRPDDLYQNPLDPAMASFVGDANIIEGTLGAGVVTTPLGRLTLSGPADELAEGGRVVVLVRPEQVAVDRAQAGASSVGRVVESQYYGHDMVLSIEMGPPGPGRLLRARLTGGRPIPLGTSVSVRASGPVTAWRADR